MNENKTNNRSVKRDLMDIALMTLGGIGGGALASGIAKSTVHSKNPVVNAGLFVLKTGGVFEGAAIGHKITNIIFDEGLRDDFNDLKDLFTNSKKSSNEEMTETEDSMEDTYDTAEDDLF